MKHPEHLKMRSLLLACCLAAAYPAAYAEETSTTTTPTTTSTTSTTTSTSSSATTTAIGTSTNTEAKLSAEFAEFLGGKEQAQAVVSGLRQGTAFSLDAEPVATGTGSTSGTSTTATSTTATIDPPTGTMGYGNVRITLRLAEAQLNQMGITQPTTEELSAVLLGGDINGTQVDGILAMRADGMGWGQIAKEYGMTVGQIMGKGAGVTKQTATATPPTQTKTSGKAGTISSSTTKSGQASQARGNGYIPSSKSTSASSARFNGYIPSGGGKSHGAGIVSAAGGSMGGAAQGSGRGQGQGQGQGQAHKITTSAQGAGAVSAGGQHVSMSGASHAGGGSNATAPGQAKKN